MSAPELAACPFCGKPAKRFGSNMVGCEDQTNCGAYVDWGHYTRGDGPISAWNRRADLHDASLTALRAQVETLREALADITDAAHGLSFGTDWNKGNHAILHGYRAKLLAAIAPARAALSAVSRDDTGEVSDG